MQPVQRAALRLKAREFAQPARDVRCKSPQIDKYAKHLQTESRQSKANRCV